MVNQYLHILGYYVGIINVYKEGWKKWKVVCDIMVNILKKDLQHLALLIIICKRIYKLKNKTKLKDKWPR